MRHLLAGRAPVTLWPPTPGDHQCRRIARVLETEGEDALDEAAGRHVGHCLRCQAVQARLRRVERWSGTSSAHTPPVDLFDDIMAGLDAEGRRRKRTEWAAMAAATAGAVYLGRRALHV